MLFTSAAAAEEIWSIGQKDMTGNEFALAPDRYADFLAEDFGFEDKYHIVGHSDISRSFPYVLPGPVDTWGGTWHTAGWRTHEVNILFSLKDQPSADAELKLLVDLADFSKKFLPLVKVSVNSADWKFQLSAPGHKVEDQPSPNLDEKTDDVPSLTGDMKMAVPKTIEVPLKGNQLHKGGNTVTITILEGSWIIFDRIALTGNELVEISVPEKLYVADRHERPGFHPARQGRKSRYPLKPARP